MDPTQSFDLETQNLQIQQKRALADALTKQSQTVPTGQMVSGHYVAPSKLSYMNQILGAYLGKRAQDSANADTANYGQNYRSQLASGLNDYLNTRSGTPGQVMNDSQASDLMNNDQAPGPLADPVAADTRKAITNAMTSRVPELQKIGQMDFANLLKKGNPETKEINGQLVSYDPLDPNSKPRTLGDYRSPMSVNGQLVAPAGGPAVGDYRDRFGPVSEVAHPANGPAIYGQTQPDTGEVHFAPGGSTFNPDKTGNVEALQQAGKVLDSTRTQYIASSGAFNDAKQIMTLAKDPAVATGFLAGPQAGLQAITAKLGFGNDPSAAAKTQALVASLAKRTLAAGQEMKGSFSDRDVQFLGAVAEGKIDLDPGVLQHAAGLSMAAAHNSMMNAQEQHSQAGTVTGAGEISKLYQIPPVDTHTMPSEMFESTGSDRYRYKSPLLGYGQSTSSAPTVSNWPGSK